MKLKSRHSFSSSIAPAQRAEEAVSALHEPGAQCIN